MKLNPHVPALLLAAALGPVTHAQPAVLTQGHVDIGVAYEDDAWDLHVHDETRDVEHEPGNVILAVGPAARTTVPTDLRFSFLGSANSPVWILPQNENPNLLFLGLAAEEIGNGVFVGDQIRFTLAGFRGPGEFALYSTSGVTGEPNVSMNTRDGISTATDFAVLPVGDHVDYNWAFSTPGNYELSIQVSGTLVAGNQFVQSDSTAYQFTVVPEPSTTALLVIGLGGVVIAVRREKRATKLNG